MTSTEKIPKAMTEKFTAITSLTDTFCTDYLNENYRELIHRVLGKLARKRPSPLLRGKENIWAAAAVHAVGQINFLDDPSQTPHCKSKQIFEYFGVTESTGQNKSKNIRDMLDMSPMDHQWMLVCRMGSNPLIWLLEIDGQIFDVRQAPLEVQELAYEKGLIPFLPADCEAEVE